MNNTSTTAAGCALLGLVTIALVFIGIIAFGVAMNIVDRL